MPASCDDANTRLTQRSGFAPAAVSAGVRSVHVPPWFCVSCTLPSSVPTQIRPARSGDSEIDVIVQNGTLRADLRRVVRRQIRADFFPVSPRLSERNSTCAPA